MTVDDLAKGTRGVVEIHPGDYLIVACDPCHVANINTHGKGTVVITIKDHSPEGACRVVEGASWADNSDN